MPRRHPQVLTPIPGTGSGCAAARLSNTDTQVANPEVGPGRLGFFFRSERCDSEKASKLRRCKACASYARARACRPPQGCLAGSAGSRHALPELRKAEVIKRQCTCARALC